MDMGKRMVMFTIVLVEPMEKRVFPAPNAAKPTGWFTLKTPNLVNRQS